MDPRTITIDPVATRMRRVGRVARRRMRIDADALRNGIHTDGTVSIAIRGLGSPAAGVPASFEWRADRPIALVIVRAGLDGDEVRFHVGPATSGVAEATGVGDGSGIRYVAFCYDAPVVPATAVLPAGVDASASFTPDAAAARRARSFFPTRRERRSILSLIPRPVARRTTGGAPA
jgi:hypothetical protein